MPRRKKKKEKGGSRPLNATAESIGAALGRVAARLDAWKRQRAEIAADIQKVMQSAQSLLGEIGEVASKQASVLIQAPSSKGGRPKGYKASAATKRKLRAAWKRRKAAAKAAEKVRDKVSGG